MNMDKTNSIDISKEDSIIKIVDMHKWYGEFHVLKNINLSVKRKERIVVCGSLRVREINTHKVHQPA